MAKFENRNEILYPLGVTQANDETVILVEAEAEEVKLLLFRAGEDEPSGIRSFRKEERVGNVWSMTIKDCDFGQTEYQIEADGNVFVEPCARKITGREQWADAFRRESAVRASMASQLFDWENDSRPELPYSDMILYRLHARGFTRHASSGVKHMGTFAGITEKIPYLKNLGVTSIELLPVTEFNEIMEPDRRAAVGAVPERGCRREIPTTACVKSEAEPTGRKEMPEPADGKSASEATYKKDIPKPADGKRVSEAACRKDIPEPANGKGISGHISDNSIRVNYWGYAPSFLFALKASYGAQVEMTPEEEFKTLVKCLHREAMECLVEIYFTGKEPPGLVLTVLRYWVQEYHVDGFHISGHAPLAMIAADPFLKGVKLLADGWEGVMADRPGRGYLAPGEGTVTVREKHLAECGSRFKEDMRRFLKGDEGMVTALAFHSRRNPPDFGVINYMADTNGFTMMDMVSYDRKHNEKNGENNRDGSDYNASWNCGAEGPTRKKKVLRLRRRQLRNAFLLLFLSQGAPMILAGDEFGNSQSGNNNAYCQDNEISWLDWKLLETNADLYQFVRHLIAFRRRHRIFHMEYEPRIMDYRACGRPDISYHGENAWRPVYEGYCRQLGILYWGPYARKDDGSEDDTFYVVYNMHWEPHVFGLPRLPKGELWHTVFDTSKEGADGYYREGEEPVLKNQVHAVIPPRSIKVFCSKKGSGYYVYETPVGELTICCREAAVTGVYFGRVIPEGEDIKEVRTELSDKTFSQLMEYFEGTRTQFDLPILMEGTEFQKKVWKALQTIPYGETRNYKEIAVMAGNEKAARAVGMANNKNPISIIVPCHRVIGANGTMVGYGGGLDVKKRLLALEQAHKAQNEGTQPG